MTSTPKEAIREQINERYPGIVEGIPYALSGFPGWVAVWRGTKVLLRKVDKADKITEPGGAEGP